MLINGLSDLKNSKTNKMKKIFLILALTVSFLGNATETDSTKVDNFKKTDEVLSKVVEKALMVAEKTGDFVIEQAPLLLQEFYAWHICSSILFILLGIAFIIIGIRLPYFWLDKEEKKWDFKYLNRYGDEGAISAWFCFGIGTIIGIIMLIVSIYDLVFILVAPKLYLIEYFIK